MFTLPRLSYKYDALAPHIDEKTMRIHHTKHHQGYVDKLNAVLKDHPDFLKKSVDSLLAVIEQVPEDIRQKVINNAGGHANHSLFWQIMSPEGGGEPEGKLLAAIKDKWGVDEFRIEFEKTAVSRFGSGWGWLVLDESGDLQIISTPNQDSPIMSGHIPLLGVDVWEHAYYLHYQNRRADYVKNFWQVINWPKVNEIYVQAKS